MNQFNGALIVASIGIAVCFAVWATVRFVKRLPHKEESLGTKIRRYLKDLLDALWGAG